MKKLALVLLAASTFVGCKPKTGDLSLSATGLKDLGSDFAYEGWIMVDGTPKTAGIFTVDANGTLSASSFELDKDDLEAATAYILTIEPSPDSDPAPSSTHILAGDFSGGSAGLTIEHGAALGNSFATAAGSYILVSPTDGPGNDNSGVWFLDPTGPAASLTLPTLPAGWVYEGWAVIDGTPVTTGTFTSVTGADASAPYSGTMDAPPFPGEDFLVNAPSGLTFPTDLAGGKAVISIEPSPDNSPEPFLLKPLAGTIPANAVAMTSYMMDNNATASSPTGTATR